MIVEKVLRDLDANNLKRIVEICTDAGNEFTSKEFHEEYGKRHIRVVLTKSRKRIICESSYDKSNSNL